MIGTRSPSRWLRRLAVVALAPLVCVGCRPKGAAQVSDRFVDLYFVEIDQKRALPLTTGLARSKMEEELSLVAQVRATIDPSQAKPSIFYTRRDTVVAGDHARLSYDLTIRQGRDETTRNALISLERVGADWRVGNFIVREGHLPAPPAGAPRSPGR
jgi:hypothetical protein